MNSGSENKKNTAVKKRVLIVEDERPMARALEIKLNNSGFEAKVASDGQYALDMLAVEKFDIILLDLVTPRKDGFDVLEELKNRGDKTPVIISSNLSQPEDIDRAKKLGARDYFVKSNTPISKVVEHVADVLATCEKCFAGETA
ncbi:MAG: response regulator [Candidatus Magasanikbacteria bacterium]|nr:response regulator [Candidatus Magasanikbacteria bacterium]